MRNKAFLFFFVLSFTIFAKAADCTDGPYGVQINGSAVVDAPKIGDPDIQGRVQYKASCVDLAVGDKVKLINQSCSATWMVDLDPYGDYQNFSGGKSAGELTCSVAGKYDFYIKLKDGDDLVYVELGKDCPQPITGDVYLAGNGTAGSAWCCGANWQADGCKLEGGQVTYTDLPAGSYTFKITDGTWSKCWGYVSVDAACSTKGYGTDADGNVAFELKEASDVVITVADSKICLTSSKGFDPINGTAVPAQCGDVILQGFYYDSYEVDTAHAGTEIYGDTKWKTLTAQADEIGAYFDLIWLPPSSYASGTGYHPKQYSNQNSDWGSRKDLATLIQTFHNIGTKVVADVVINHSEAMSSWCDMAVENFGNYGLFEPDVSWICKTDEMNSDPKAGDCLGLATGNEDDGANWQDARDWSHDMPKVQEMFKAYTKWLLKEVGYDGFRYDKGDGFNSWHLYNYNSYADPYIAFMECWTSNGEIKRRIGEAKNDIMAFDFQTKYRTFNDGIAKGNYENCRMTGISSWGENDIGLLASGMSKYAITFIDNHDMFLRDGNEFGGAGKSLSPEMKDRFLQANAYLLSMPGVPCVLYPHWVKYKDEINALINARHLAGVHSESEVKDEMAEGGGYQATIVGKNGWLILQLGNKATKTAWDSDYRLAASGAGYSVWVNATGDATPGLMVTPSADFLDAEQGMKVGMKAVGGSGTPTIYYTLDGTDPTTESTVYTDTLVIKETTTLKAMAVCGTAQSKVQTFTYTYREPLKHGIQIHFNKPAEWDKVYIFAWNPGTDEQGNPTAENLMGAYPGQRIYQDAEGWFSYEFDLSLETVHFCINAGDDCGGLNVRSNDLEESYDAYYVWEEGFETQDKYEKKLEEKIELEPAFDLSVSPESGNFRDQTEGQTVTMRVVGHEGASIYYSTDGSDPSLCAEPAMDELSLTVNQTTTVRAFAQYSPNPTSTIKTDEYQVTYTYKAPQSGPITVKFIRPNEYYLNEKGDTISRPWKDLYLYAFTRVKVGSKFKDTPYALDGKTTKWPGMKWTTTEKDGKGQEWYTWTMKDDIKEIYVIFTEGDKKPQTQDIYLTENMCYVWNPTCRRAVEDPDCDGVADGLQEIIANPELLQSAFRKIIVNDHLYILHDNRMYNIFGCPLR